MPNMIMVSRLQLILDMRQKIFSISIYIFLIRDAVKKSVIFSDIVTIAFDPHTP